MGPCAGGAVYSPAITDFVAMVEGSSYMFLTGPDVIKTVMHEDVSAQDLGGAAVHSARSGVAHFSSANDQDCLALIRELLSYLPSNNREDAPRLDPTDDPRRADVELDELVPVDPNRPYDIVDLISRVVDHGNFLQVHEAYARNLVTGFARLHGMPVGIVANQPDHLAGTLDIDASVKGARFVRFCDAFNIPLVVFEDVPGFLPGTEQEFAGIIKHGAKLLYAFAEATVPKLTVITRKAYGGAYCVMASKHIRTDVNFAYPAVEIAVMGSEGAVNVLFRRELAAAEDAEALWATKVKEFRDKFANPYVAAERGWIDEVIHPRDTRPRLIRALLALDTKATATLPRSTATYRSRPLAGRGRSKNLDEHAGRALTVQRTRCARAREAFGGPALGCTRAPHGRQYDAPAGTERCYWDVDRGDPDRDGADPTSATQHRGHRVSRTHGAASGDRGGANRARCAGQHLRGALRSSATTRRPGLSRPALPTMSGEPRSRGCAVC